MIGKEQMMELLLDACPSFRPRWEAFLEEWQETDDLPLYLALGDFAVLLIGMFPLFYGARKIAYASMGLGLVDDARK